MLVYIPFIGDLNINLSQYIFVSPSQWSQTAIWQFGVNSEGYFTLLNVEFETLSIKFCDIFLTAAKRSAGM